MPSYTNRKGFNTESTESTERGKRRPEYLKILAGPGASRASYPGALGLV